MTLAEPILYVVGGFVLGLCIPGFYKHHLLGITAIIIGGVLIGLAATNTTLTLPRPEIHLPPLPKSSPTSTVSPVTPSRTSATP
jgi:hypothetical protein